MVLEGSTEEENSSYCTLPLIEVSTDQLGNMVVVGSRG